MLSGGRLDRIKGLFVSLVDNTKLTRLRAALQSDWTLRSTATWSEFVSASRTMSAVLVLDPPVSSRSGAPFMVLATETRTFLRDSSAPIVIYTDASHAAAAVAVPRTGGVHLIIAGIDDQPAALRYRLSQALTEGPAQVVAGALVAASSVRNRHVLTAIARLLETESEIGTASQLAHVMGLSRTALYRSLATCHIRSPAAILQVLKVSKFYRLLVANRLDVKKACVVMGCSDGRSLRRASWTVLGTRRLSAIRTLSPDDVARRCVECLCGRE